MNEAVRQCGSPLPHFLIRQWPHSPRVSSPLDDLLDRPCPSCRCRPRRRASVSGDAARVRSERSRASSACATPCDAAVAGWPHAPGRSPVVARARRATHRDRASRRRPETRRCRCRVLPSRARRRRRTGAAARRAPRARPGAARRWPRRRRSRACESRAVTSCAVDRDAAIQRECRRSRATDAAASASLRSTPCCCACHATARYIAPVSMWRYPRRSASVRATVPLPAPEGPSIAMMSGAARHDAPFYDRLYDAAPCVDHGRTWIVARRWSRLRGRVARRAVRSQRRRSFSIWRHDEAGSAALLPVRVRVRDDARRAGADALRRDRGARLRTGRRQHAQSRSCFPACTPAASTSRAWWRSRGGWRRRALASLSVPLPDLREFRITPRSTDMIEDATLWIAANRALAPSGRVGARRRVVRRRPGARRRRPAVARGQSAARRLDRRPRGSAARHDAISARASCRTARRARRTTTASSLMLLDARSITSCRPSRSSRCAHAILTFLDASSYDQTRPRRRSKELFDLARARTARRCPSRRGPTCSWVNDRNATSARRGAAAARRGRSAARPRSRRSDRRRRRAPVFLLHGAADNVIPSTETPLLAAYLAEHGNAGATWLLTPLVSHATFERGRRGGRCVAAGPLLEGDARRGPLAGVVRAVVSARISAGVRSRISPGRRPRSVIVPMRVRRSRSTGCAMASHMWRTCRLRPSRSVSSMTACAAAPAADARAAAGRRAGSVRRPSIVDAAAQPLEIAIVRHAGDLRFVRALQLVARMRHALGEVAVVGEEDQAFGVVVEPADRDRSSR